jgi:hypothetical protein
VRPRSSGERAVEHACDALHDLLVDITRGRQVDPGGGKLSAVGTAAGVLAVRRQRRQRVEERPGLILASWATRMIARRLSAGTCTQASHTTGSYLSDTKGGKRTQGMPSRASR